MTTFPLDLRTEFQIAAAWQDATSLVYQRDGNAPPAVIQRARQDEASKLNGSSSTFEVNNRSGQFSPLNPLGPWYGSFSRNTPVRHSIPAQANYLRLEANSQDRAFVSDTSVLHITGSIEMRIALELTDWQGGVLANKWDGGGCWQFILNPNGTLTFEWNDSGVVFHSVASTVPVPFFRGTQALRVTMDAATGNVTFYTAATIDGTYSQLGAVNSGTGGAATSVQSVITSALQVGYGFNISPGQVCGRVAEYRLYNGIAGAGGTVVADTVMSAVTAGATTWTDSAGLTWNTAGGAEVSSRDYRYHGECSALPPTWDATGTDQSVKVTAGGIWRRLSQGQVPVQSPIRRAIATQSGTLAPVAYWPCEDASGSLAFGSASGGALMTFDGSPTLASDSTFACSAPLPVLHGSRWHGRVPTYSGTGSIVVRWPLKVGTLPSSKQPLVRLVTTGTATTVTFSVDNSGFGYLSGTSATGSSVFSDGPFFALSSSSFSQTPGWMSIELRPSGGTVNVTMVMLTPLGTVAYTLVSDSFSGSVGNVADVYVNPSGAFTDTVAGHVSVQPAWVSMFSLQRPLDSWAGETAAARAARLCAEDGIACRIIGSPAYSAAMGEQGIDTLQNLLQSVEDADQGQLFEPRQTLGLGYRTLASMCNQAARVVIDYSQAQLGGNTGGGSGTGLAPTLDDSRLRNDWTVTRGSPGSGGTQGATYQAQLQDGSAESVAVAGDYSDSLTANVEYDTAVPNLAGWKVHTGTAGEYRWPAIPFNLRRNAIQNASLYYPLLSLDVGDYLELVNMPSVILFDPVKQLSWGLKESLGGFHHQLELNGVPESVYEVMTLDDPVYGRADTDGTTLASSVTSSATGLSLATAAGFPVWTQSPSDYPFDLNVAGERVCALCAGTVTDSNPQLAGLTGWSPQNGTAALDSTHLYTSSLPAVLITPNGSSSSGGLIASAAATSGVTPGALYQLAGLCYSPQGWSDVRMTADWYNGGTFLSTTLGSPTVVPAGAWTVLAQQVTAPATSTGVILRFRWGSTPASSVQFWIQDLTIVAASSVSATSPQAVSVVRSVNGVVKAQASGADVRLWFPPVLAWQ